MKVAEMIRQENPYHTLRVLDAARHVPTVQLLAVALGMSDTDKADRMLAACEGSLRRLATTSRAVLKERAAVDGRTVVRARAVLELGRRLAAESRDDGDPVRSPRDVHAIMAPRMEDLAVEEFHVLILNSQHRLERDVLVTRGILNSSLVHPREVFKAAIECSAAAIILCHNHPSGDPAPSADDRLVTDQLVAAGRLLDLPVHDHVIIGRGRYLSFSEAGLI